MTVTTATAADYAWLPARFPALATAYCLTLVRGLAPGRLLDRLGGAGAGVLTGVENLLDASYQAWDDHGSERLLLAATEPADGWTLALELASEPEPNGRLGGTPELLLPLSAGTELVAHTRSVTAEDHFCWVLDGELRVTFEPLFPNRRGGSTPDALVTEMAAVGFDLSPGGPAIAPGPAVHTAAAFALAERLTGVRLLPDQLDGLPFTYGLIPNPAR